MKKNLLVLGTLALTVPMLHAQEALTYIGDQAKVFVSSNTLLYSGGNLKLNSAIEKTVENNGNIMVVGGYLKGAQSLAADDGKEFVNVYNGSEDYGQVIILNPTGATVSTNARMTTERPAASSGYFDATFPISFPYKDDVSYLMRAFGKSESEFIGNCAIGANCGVDLVSIILL